MRKSNINSLHRLISGSEFERPVEMLREIFLDSSSRGYWKAPEIYEGYHEDGTKEIVELDRLHYFSTQNIFYSYADKPITVADPWKKGNITGLLSVKKEDKLILLVTVGFGLHRGKLSELAENHWWPWADGEIYLMSNPLKAELFFNGAISDTPSEGACREVAKNFYYTFLERLHQEEGIIRHRCLGTTIPNIIEYGGIKIPFVWI